ncbi:exodeoxyribonuclease VII large subunit [Acidithiobacillus sp. AMEEHan]|uniref:exodeoxyribonuclease VII large subunit n=1 Tax=Acidithiobacillus sp. AMEEHan TaxID=2994951 RepID=UPI0027E4A7E9|nr:exodeoxyribonuclease VII large subunit [Acidithiobacillus sp. AMEEHan]
MSEFATSLPVLRVSDLNSAVREIIEGNFPPLRVEGEISNFACPSSGHWYFSLKDAQAQVRCAMFRNRNGLQSWRPRDGQQVQVIAQPTLYEGRGEFQLIVEQMEELGAGNLAAEFQRIKDKLAAEGLFANEHKQPLPQHPRRVAVITSATGAAWHDIRVTLAKRWPLLELLLYPVQVQGDAAAAQIVAALESANRRATEDLIILARGGGSAEDLWCFNDERIARAIHASTLPVVTGIGHEIDFTIADFVADWRAATPTAAAEQISPDREEWAQRIRNQRQRLRHSIERHLREATLSLDYLRARLRNPLSSLQQQERELTLLRSRLRREMRVHLMRSEQRQGALRARLRRLDPRQAIDYYLDHTARSRDRLRLAIQRQLEQREQELDRHRLRLLALNPTAVLERGYAIVRDSQGVVLRSSAGVAVGACIDVQLWRGRLYSQVLEREE